MISKFKILVSVTVAALVAFFAFSAPAASSVPVAEASSLSLWFPTPHWAGFDPWRSGPTGGAGSASDPASTSSAPGDVSGLVLINTEVDFGTARAAGTGMVIDPDGIVVTNHHVVAGSTAVTVTDPATGRTYTAEVLGYDATIDVAVLRLDGADGLATITADTNPVAAGQAVTAIGNAQGGGQLVSSTGQITATGQDITVTGDDGTQADLTDLIAITASLVPGDSGGALLDADSEVIGMNVAGSTSSRFSMDCSTSGASSRCAQPAVGYAIPISAVLQVAEKVLAGTATDTVSLGRTGAIGVQVSTQAITSRTGRGLQGIGTGSQTGVYIVGVIEGGPADMAGVTSGSTLTSIDGESLTSQAGLSAILASHQAGDRVSLTWTDIAGASHTAVLTLTDAPLA